MAIAVDLGRKATKQTIKQTMSMIIPILTNKQTNNEYGYLHSNALLQFDIKLERCKPYKATRHRRKCDVINDVKLFPTVDRRIYCHKFMMLSNQTSHYKIKCIRNPTLTWMSHLGLVFLLQETFIVMQSQSQNLIGC